MKRAFTIVELLVSISIISILMTIVFASVKGSISDARQHHAEALCQAVQAGLAAYRAQYDEWPDPVGSWVKGGNAPSRMNREGAGGENDSGMVVLEASEVQQMVRALVDEAKKGNPLMDISGLFVSRDAGEGGGRGYGLSFIDAVHGTSKSRRKMSTSEMKFGYADPSTGHFRRFKMVYSVPADGLVVTLQ